MIFNHSLSSGHAPSINHSLSSGHAPTIWKASDILPIPKESSPTQENDLRPISLNPCLAKVLEKFNIVEWLLQNIRAKRRQRRQRGSGVWVLDLHADVPGSNLILTTVWICLG